MLQLNNLFKFLPPNTFVLSSGSKSTTPSATDTWLQPLPLVDNLSSLCDESIVYGESTSQASSSLSSSLIDTANKCL
ncbi:hypothetical protein HETIRDRAFT_322917 [Heterobasidion irregulare TC 32-1]|uniref:Uncharacterized protein n=1 Tax=Heterobasidion irregulare (strain TC 32-1) TaxID=747525 RepID=W4K4B2_HETIT|nr:uncharacterized protein HETIRDRAFT_322917 [Heterobasidion irregulare TC 32-1]ETW80180.1 hypothetical protein HETIRDRAFT_322917 [Heterobasidion irregulare TC 32-1]